ncbi:N-carbamoyl-D-amino-acid hydrolase [Bordetella avium]|nr:N-carbamoyl-D-amino-acid hydrolase [Bordetella avium]AZY50789.1 N-carbamoyl-D-amino-acid hydrolase [Bordetella avium]AZY51604.1 N-carbamoyl-D-amino-acid hydrolase [Bordetella avium]RIQ13593.1 N-carbamoyl-D-amino-acid hydrolase [Bordetella avium]RIQ16513.1 N-carbamoyl-D-amino-acid hydrolase [Bordetella avium]RIQ31271.1 N-carbamoyl-D-amino-acid hydrolase [Bordetella avium]
MSRIVTVAAAQLGPIQRAEGRESVVARMIRLLERAQQRGAQVVVFPELALTTFFPRWYCENRDEADGWFETSLPSPATQPLFDAIKRYGLMVYLGYAELAWEPDEQGVVRKRRFNTSVVIAPNGEIVFKYRKVHLPGQAEFAPYRKVQHLEKRYFEVGNLGFPVVRTPVAPGLEVNMGMLICNDRRWPEAWRVLGLQQVELVMVGYNTPSLNHENQGFEAHHLRVQNSQLSVQAGCYQNATFGVSVAKAGKEDGHELFGHSIIVNPQGEVIALAASWDDELVVADCNLAMCDLGRNTLFNFAKHRRPEAYSRIVEQTGSVAPAQWKPSF